MLNHRLLTLSKVVALAFFLPTSLYAQQKTAAITRHSGKGQDRGEIFRYVEHMPVFKGDLSTFLSSEIVYPDSARVHGRTGKSVVEFVVNENGKVSNIRIARSAGDTDLDAEAMRAVRAMPDWIPGKQSGKHVKVYFTLPITFQLD